MTGIELLRKYAETRLSDGTCRQLPDAFGKGCDDFGNCDDCHRFVRRVIADQIEREIEEVVADEVVDTLSAYEINTNARWYSAVADGPGNDCRDEYELISRYWLPRPRFEDGKVVQIGDKAMFHGTEQEVDSYSVTQDGDALIHSIVDCFWLSHKGRAKRPEPPKVLDADGVEINVGDEVWLIEDGGGPWTVASIVSNNRVKMTDGSGWYCNAHCKCITHKRPEPEDSWEQIEADASDDIMVRDLVRRAKKLAGVE